MLTWFIIGVVIFSALGAGCSRHSASPCTLLVQRAGLQGSLGPEWKPFPEGSKVWVSIQCP